MNKYIVAIGGGELCQLETLKIDQEIVALSGKKHPKLLFIPTASSDAAGYVQVIQEVYGLRLGCTVDSLLLLREKPSRHEIEAKIRAADIIYVGGGNTLKMMNLWRRFGVDSLLRSAYERGAVLCGISAGAICWFESGHSDSMSFYHPDNWQYIRVTGIKLLRGICCPHFDGETRGIKRKKSFSGMILKIGGHGLAIDNRAAIIFCNDAYKIISAKEGAKVYSLFKKNKQVVVKPIEEKQEFASTSLLQSPQ